jgi:hypothetical protein
VLIVNVLPVKWCGPLFIFGQPGVRRRTMVFFKIKALSGLDTLSKLVNFVQQTTRLFTPQSTSSLRIFSSFPTNFFKQ